MYSQEAVVHVWRNVRTMGIVPTSHFGHAAISLRGSLVPTGPGDNYISFWPGDSAGIGKSAFTLQDGSASDDYGADMQNEMNKLTALRLEIGYRNAKGKPYPSYWDAFLAEEGKSPIDAPRTGQTRTKNQFILREDDGTPMLDEFGQPMWIPLWSQSPESTTTIPGLGAGGCIWGLSTRRMGEWWRDFQKTEGFKYRALSRSNCAGIALLGMREGGAEAFCEIPTIKIYAEPRQVEEYAQLVLMQIQRMEAWTTELEQDIFATLSAGFKSGAMGVGTAAPADSIWSLADWKAASALGTFQIRSSTIRAIDDAVEKFHASNWTTSFPVRYKAMADIILNITKHRQEKPESKRSEGICKLGHQVITLLKSPASPAL